MVPLFKFVALYFTWVSNTRSHEARLMYLLLWTNDNVYTHNYKLNSRRVGSDIFSNCEYNNCYLTDDQDFFGAGQVTKFDAILFNGRTLSMKTRRDELPKERVLSQKYVYVCAEPICNSSFYRRPNTCNPVLYELFNMTAIIYQGGNYEIDFSDRNHDYSGLPRVRRQESDSVSDINFLCKNDLRINETLLLRNKKKAVAWFMSNCTNKNMEIEYTNNLTISLGIYDQTLDIYGCGHLECPKKSRRTKCDDKLRDEYFFYLDFDHSVDNKSCPIASLANNSVPIFYGEFDSRYLPLGTYIDAVQYTPETLASVIVYLMNQPKRYSDYFRFRNRSVPYYPVNAHFYPCRICRAFNSPRYMNFPHTCHYLNKGWYPDWRHLCSKKYDFDYMG